LGYRRNPFGVGSYNNHPPRVAADGNPGLHDATPSGFVSALRTQHSALSTQNSELSTQHCVFSHKAAHLARFQYRLPRARKVLLQITSRKHLIARRLDCLSLILEVKRISEHHRRSQYRPKRIRNSLLGYVRRRAMHRLIEAYPATDRRRSQQPERPHYRPSLVRQNVAKHVLGHNHIKARRTRYQRHRARIHQLVVEGNIRILRRYSIDCFAPQLRALEYVAFVDRRDLSPAFAR